MIETEYLIAIIYILYYELIGITIITGLRVYRKYCVKFENKPSYDKIKMS